MVDLVFERFPTLGAEFHLASIASDEHAAQLGLGDVSDETYSLQLAHLLVVGEGDGEEQLIVFASVEGTGDDVHVELLGHHRGLVIKGDVLFIDAASLATLLADVHEL